MLKKLKLLAVPALGISILFIIFSSFDVRLGKIFSVSAATESVSIIRQDCTGYSSCYTSLSTWEAAQQRDLVASNEIVVARIEGTWTNPDTAAVTVSGWTTGPDNYIRIYTAPEARHSGVWDAGKYRLESTNTTPLTISSPFVRIDGVQIDAKRSTPGRADGIDVVSVANGDIYIQNLIIRGSGGQAANGGSGIFLGGLTGPTSTAKISNNIIYDFFYYGDNGIGIRSYGNWTTYAFNNTVYGGYYPFQITAGTFIAKNNIAQSSYGSNFSGTFSNLSNNNISNDTTSPGGANDKKNQTITFTDSANKNFHIASSDITALDAGIDLSADANLAFTTDADGETRSGSWDIGADEYIASQGGGTPSPSDTAPPTRSGGSPSVALAAGTTQTTLMLTTNENATCKYGAAANTAYALIANTFSTTGNTSHSASAITQNGQSYTYYIRCSDNSGNTNTDDYIISFSVDSPSAADTTAPSVPTNLTANAISSSQINLSWAASTDNIGIAGYKIYRNGVQIATTTTASYSNIGLTPSTNYSYAISAFDTANNISVQTALVSATTQGINIVSGTNRYMATTGVDSGNCSNETTPCLTLQYAMSQMQGGDTLFIDDGNYTSAKNGIDQFHFPPSGSSNNLTNIRAKNIPCQNGVPCDQPLKVKFSGSAIFQADGPGSGAPNYVKFWGIRWDGIQTYAGWNHLYFKQVASQGIQDGNTAAISINGQYNLLEDVIAFGKGRYKILFYDPSRDLQSYGPGNNLCRRCVARHDWAKKNDTAPDPIAGIASYYNRGTSCLNCMVIDSDTPSEWMDNPTELSGAFYQPVDTGPHAFIVKGSLVINTAMAAYYNRSGSTGHIIQDLVSVKTAGGLGLQGDTYVNRATLVNIGKNNFTYRSTTQSGTILAPDDGCISFNGGGQTISNSIIRGTVRDGIRGGGFNSDYMNMFSIGGSSYANATPAQHLVSIDPSLNGLKYPVRIEDGSPLQTQGSNGGQIGARIVNKLGVDGTFKNDSNWDTEQSESLWPWPLEAWIKAEMKTSQYTSDPNRGFAAAGTGLYGGPITLTSYIWESLGNPCPNNICSSSSASQPTLTDTIAPAISSVQAATTTTSAIITWATDENASSQVEYGLTTSYDQSTAVNSTMTTSHSRSIAGLSPNTTYNYRVISRDATGNAAISQNRIFVTASAPDLAAPSTISNLAVSNMSQSSLTLAWVAPTDNSGVASYDLRYSTSPITDTNFSSATTFTALPTPRSAGFVEQYIAVGLTPGTTYYFAMKSTDSAGNTSALSNVVNATTASAPSTTSTTPSTNPGTISVSTPTTNNGGSVATNYTVYRVTDSTAPGAPTNTKINTTDSQISLSWANPTDSDFVRVKILRKTDTYPTSATEGIIVYGGKDTSFVDTGLTNGTTYYYTIYAYDAVPNYSVPVKLSAIPKMNTTQTSIIAEKNETSTTSTTLPHPAGALLRDSVTKRTYYIDNGGVKRLITSPSAFSANNFSWNRVIDVSGSVLGQYADGFSVSGKITVATSTPANITPVSNPGQSVVVKVMGIPAAMKKAVLVKVKNTIYAIVSGQRHAILSPSIFNAYKYTWNRVKNITATQLNKYPRVKLVKAVGSPAVYYITDRGQKKVIPSAAIFLAYGNKWTDIIEILPEDLAKYPDVKLIRLEGDTKIYLIESNMKRYVKSTSVIQGMGLKMEDVVNVKKIEFDHYQTGPDAI